MQNTMYKWRYVACLVCLLTVPSYAGAQPHENIEDLPRLPYLRMEFAFEDSRATTIEDGLEFVEATGTWGVYRVSSANPRLYMPGVDHDPEILRHHISICSSAQFFGTGFDGSERFNLRVYGVRSDGAPDQLLGEDTLHGQDFGNCSRPVDARTGDPDEVHLDRTYLAFGEPQPPLGTLITLRMVGINSPHDGTARVTHDNAWPICCPTELGCEVDAPPEPPGGGEPDGGPEEPPGDGGLPDGGLTEPAGVSSPSDALEPTCALAAHRTTSPRSTWLALLLLSIALLRRVQG